MTRILIVEDDVDLANGLRNNLEIEGYEVAVEHDGETALAAIDRWRPALLILDLVLPGIEGLRVLRTVRARDSEIGILIVTARGGESDKVRGLKLGADDYVTKPFGLLELLARVESVLRRRQPARAGDEVNDAPIRFGEIEVHRSARRVLKRGVAVALRPKEFDLLVELLAHRGRVVSRVALMQAVWGYSSAVISRTVDTHVGELRRKLEADASQPSHIMTVRGAGYRLDG